MGIAIGVILLLVAGAFVFAVHRAPAVESEVAADAVPPEDLPPEVGYALLPHHAGGINPNAAIGL